METEKRETEQKKKLNEENVAAQFSLNFDFGLHIVNKYIPAVLMKIANSVQSMFVKRNNL